MHARELVILRHALGLTPAALARAVGVSLYGMELDPGYVAVSVERMADMGLSPRVL